jgi:hypothetical protein
VRYNWTAIILLFIASLSHAQDATPSEREMIQQLVQQVTALQQKVQVLESQLCIFLKMAEIWGWKMSRETEKVVCRASGRDFYFREFRGKEFFNIHT